MTNTANPNNCVVAIVRILSLIKIIMEYYKNLELKDIEYVNDEDVKCIEIWKDIPSYEGLYQVSDLGRVKGLPRMVDSGRGLYKIEERILKQSDASYGYLHLALSKNKKSKHLKAHTLVAMAFFNFKRNGITIIVNHKNQNRKDNRLCSLEIISQRENTNQKHLPSTSKFVGVYFHNTHKKWCSAIRIKDKKFHLGAFKTEIEAAEAYNKALKDWEEQGLKPEPKKFGSQYKGVTYIKERCKWVAKIKINGKLTHIGTFKTEIEAHNAFQESLKQNPGATA